MHKRVQPKAKEMLHAIWMAPTRAAGEQAFDAFIAMFAAKYPAAVDCLRKDRDVLLTFYDFPAVIGQAKPASCGQVKTGHLEEAVNRCHSLFSQWLAGGGCVWRITSRWHKYRRYRHFEHVGGLSGGLAGSWACIERRWPGTSGWPRRNPASPIRLRRRVAKMS